MIHKLFDFKQHVYDFKYGFRNLMFWLPKVWKDRDFDSHFILELLKFKLEKVLDYSENRSPIQYVGQDEHESQIKEVIDCLDRIIKDEYVEETCDSSILSKIHAGFDFDDSSSLVWKEPLSDIENEIYMTSVDIADLKKMTDIHRVFDLMSENIRDWWI